VIGSQPGVNSSRDPISKILFTHTHKRAGGVTDLEGGDQKDHSLRPAWPNGSQNPISIKLGVVECACHSSHGGSIGRTIAVLANWGKKARPCMKNKGWGMTQVAECLSSKHKAMSSKPSIPPRKKKKKKLICEAGEALRIHKLTFNEAHEIKIIQ
jgi:hypothetical protein